MVSCFVFRGSPTKLPWREAGPPNHHDDKVDSDQYLAAELVELARGVGGGRRERGRRAKQVRQQVLLRPLLVQTPPARPHAPLRHPFALPPLLIAHPPHRVPPPFFGDRLPLPVSDAAGWSVAVEGRALPRLRCVQGLECAAVPRRARTALRSTHMPCVVS